MAEKQTKLDLYYKSTNVGLTSEAYEIIKVVKNSLIKKHKKHFTFSDAIIELKNKANGINVEFTQKEVIQIKKQLGTIK